MYNRLLSPRVFPTRRRIDPRKGFNLLATQVGRHAFLRKRAQEHRRARTPTKGNWLPGERLRIEGDGIKDVFRAVTLRELQDVIWVPRRGLKDEVPRLGKRKRF